MKKIMFNDKYGLTRAVLEGRKTQTRRIIQKVASDSDRWFLPTDYWYGRVTSTGERMLLSCSHKEQYDKMKENSKNMSMVRIRQNYLVGEEVAIAQSYHDTVVLHNGSFSGLGQTSRLLAHAGAKNKMFVKAEYMPHRIKITDVRVEHLQEISDEDCLKEGVIKLCDSYRTTASDKFFHTPQEAFAVLIDKVSGKGTWESNPWVFVYDFELVK